MHPTIFQNFAYLQSSVWHSNLRCTRNLYGEEVFKELLNKVLSLCVEKGMVSGIRQELDNLEEMLNHVSPGERNPFEGKFGQAKIAYGMNNILDFTVKLKTTSESWIG